MVDEFGVSDAVKAAEVVKDVLPETTKEADGIISTVVGLFNNVVLFPLKKANLSYRYKLEDFRRELEEKVRDVPPENLRSPRKNIVGPILECLRYAGDEKEIRDIFVKLLAEDMDSRNGDKVHPSYVEIARQVDCVDVQLFKYIATCKGYIKAVNPSIGISGTDQIYIGALPNWYISTPFENTIDPFSLSAALIRLANFGLIELMYDRTSGIDGYPNPEDNRYIVGIFNAYKKEKSDQKLEIHIMKSVIQVNDFGRRFAEICF